MLDLRQEARQGQGYAADAVDKDPPVIAGDMGSNSGLGRICLSLQGTWVQILVWEDSTCLRETKPSAPQLLSPSSRVREPQ